MKKAFLITSVIDIDRTAPLTYTNTRSVFDKNERLRQTIFSITSLDLISDDECTFFLIDLSDDNETYEHCFSFQKNLKYISVKKEFPEILNVCRTHKNKSHAECLLLYTFMEKYQTVLKDYDYFFKLSGRYFFNKTFNLTMFNHDNLDKLFFKKPLEWEWKDQWNYQIVDRRDIQKNNKLRQYSTVLFGWGLTYFDVMKNLFKHMSHILNIETHYDIETLIYFFSRAYADNIIETDWKVYGWNSTTGEFLAY